MINNKITITDSQIGAYIERNEGELIVKNKQLEQENKRLQQHIAELEQQLELLKQKGGNMIGGID